MLGFIRSRKKTPSMPSAHIYPYDFPTTGYRRIDDVRFQIEDQSEWDITLDIKVACIANLEAAALFGFGPVFSPEQNALFDLLLKLQAGPHIMTYAWGVYADLLKTASASHEYCLAA